MSCCVSWSENSCTSDIAHRWWAHHCLGSVIQILRLATAREKFQIFRKSWLFHLYVYIHTNFGNICMYYAFMQHPFLFMLIWIKNSTAIPAAWRSSQKWDICCSLSSVGVTALCVNICWHFWPPYRKASFLLATEKKACKCEHSELKSHGNFWKYYCLKHYCSQPNFMILNTWDWQRGDAWNKWAANDK